jgi:hypothetical protein
VPQVLLSVKKNKEEEKKQNSSLGFFVVSWPSFPDNPSFRNPSGFASSQSSETFYALLFGHVKTKTPEKRERERFVAKFVYIHF